ncbi:hypothetical protein ABPG75_010822 [Micractinium tetrahymenae]
MDGNSRWARSRGLPAAVGYQQGVEALRRVVRCCHEWGIPCLTVYAFSSENWRRSPAEVAALLALMERVVAAEVAELAAAGVRLRFIGELERLPAPLRRRMASAELATADNCSLHLTVAVSYSGQQDLTRAVREIAALAAAGQLPPQGVTPELIEAHLATRVLPPAWRQPDLVVRTSGEQRLSNFMCFEAAYSELHFSPVMWPDFGEKELAEALRDFAGRERRFGGRQARGERSNQGSSCGGGSGHWGS